MRKMACARILVTVLLIRLTIFAEGKPDHMGREFVFGFPHNAAGTGKENINPEIVVTTMEDVNVTVTVTIPNLQLTIKEFVISRNYSYTVNFTNQDSRINHMSNVSTGIKVVSTHEIAVYGVNKQIASTDSFLVLPVDVLGNKHFVTVTNQTNQGTGEYNSEMALVAIEDNTEVDVFHQLEGPGPFRYNGTDYHYPNHLRFTLNAYEAAGIASDFSINGLVVSSNKKLAVFSGANRAAGKGVGATDNHVVEQIPAVNTLGKEFVLPNVQDRTGYEIQVLVTENGTDFNVTEISYTGEVKSVASPQSVNAGQAFGYGFSDTNVHVISNKRLLVVQHCDHGVPPTPPKQPSGYSDPFMMMIPAVEQFLSAYTFATVTTAESLNFSNYINVVIESGKESALVLDGLPITNTWAPIPSLGGTSFVVANISIDPGTHSIHHTSPIEKFGVYVYGHAKQECYGHPAGIRVFPLDKNCTSKSMTAGDGLDNDCDGRWDEELKNMKDDDGDGEIDEDLALGFGEKAPDINECNDTSHTCHSDADCSNTKGGYNCTCKPGYTGSGYNCTDINECNGLDNCHSNATCVNNAGSYDCNCNGGYAGDGITCKDIDECQGFNKCHFDADCANTDGSYKCTCKRASYGDGITCSRAYVSEPAPWTVAVSVGVPFGVLALVLIVIAFVIAWIRRQDLRRREKNAIRATQKRSRRHHRRQGADDFRPQYHAHGNGSSNSYGRPYNNPIYIYS